MFIGICFESVCSLDTIKMSNVFSPVVVKYCQDESGNRDVVRMVLFFFFKAFHPPEHVQ